MAFASIVPVISAISRIPQAEVNQAFIAAWDQAREINGGRVDTRTYVEAVSILRQEVPFTLADLQSGWRAKDAIDGKPYPDKPPITLMT